MIAKIYDRDFEYTMEQVGEVQAKLNTIAAGVTRERSMSFGRFEFPLTGDLTEAQQTTFVDWVAIEHPDWSVVWR